MVVHLQTQPMDSRKDNYVPVAHLFVDQDEGLCTKTWKSVLRPLDSKHHIGWCAREKLQVLCEK